jgi:hypothetical protein
MDFMGPQIREAENIVSELSASVLKNSVIFFAQENKTVISSIFIFL